MKCPACQTEMRYFRDYDPPGEGYRCGTCGHTQPIPVVEIDEEETANV
jgi:primosomal protein N'